MTTVNDLVQNVEKALSMYAGVDVQTYAEDRILLMIQHQFNMIFDKLWWADFLAHETFTLDGSTGVITGDVTDKIKRFGDIYAVWFENEADPLPRLPNNINPATVKLRSITPYNLASKRFKIVPADTAGDVTVRYRTKPADFALADDLVFDHDLLLYAAVHTYLVEDGTNQEAQAMYKAMLDQRYNDLKNLEEHIPYSTRDYSNSLNDVMEWRTP